MHSLGSEVREDAHFTVFKALGYLKQSPEEAVAVLERQPLKNSTEHRPASCAGEGLKRPNGFSPITWTMILI